MHVYEMILYVRLLHVRICYVKFYLLVAVDINVVLAERKLTTYVYAVGKQPCSNS